MSLTAPAADASLPFAIPESASPGGGALSPRLGSPLLFDPLPDPRDRTVSFLGGSFITGEVLLDLPASAKIDLGGELGVSIGNLRYTGFDLANKSGDSALHFDLTPAQQSAWNHFKTGSADPLEALLGSPVLETIASTLDALRDQTAGLPPDQALALVDRQLREVAAALRTGETGTSPALAGIDPALLQPFADTLKTIVDHFYYERAGEAGLRNLELRGEFSGSAASQYRYVTASGDQIYADVTRGFRASTENSLGLRLVMAPGGIGLEDATTRTRMDNRSSSSSTSLTSFTLGRNRWALAVTEIQQDQKSALDVRRLGTGLGTAGEEITRSDYSHSRASSQVENRVWALRRARQRDWDLELGVGLGGLRTRFEERALTRGSEAAAPAPSGPSTAVAPGSSALPADLAALEAAYDPASAGGIARSEAPALLAGSPGIESPLGGVHEEAYEGEWLEAGSQSRLGGGALVGARRDSGAGELGLRAIYFGQLQQQLTAAVGRRQALGRLGVVGDLQADLVRQPGVVWEERAADYRLGVVSTSAVTPTAAVVWSLRDEALAGLHTWQSPFEFTARRRDPRRLGRALFAGASGARGDELFAGMSFHAGSYLSASMRQGEGSYRHYTLSGRARSLQMEVGMGSGTQNGASSVDGRHEVSLSYLQFVYNRDGERYLSLTLNPETRELDVAMSADSQSLASSLGRAWTRLRRRLGL